MVPDPRSHEPTIQGVHMNPILITVISAAAGGLFGPSMSETNRLLAMQLRELQEIRIELRVQNEIQRQGPTRDARRDVDERRERPIIIPQRPGEQRLIPQRPGPPRLIPRRPGPPELFPQEPGTPQIVPEPPEGQPPPLTPEAPGGPILQPPQIQKLMHIVIPNPKWKPIPNLKWRPIR